MECDRPPTAAEIRQSSQSHPAKAYVPPLLSPLNIGFDGAEDGDTGKKKQKRRRDDDGPQDKPGKVESTTDKKSSKPTAPIPPLLSPTLPPQIEAELRRQKKQQLSDSSDERMKDKRDALGIKKESEDEEQPRVPSKLGHRRRLLIVLSVPPRLRTSFGHIMKKHRKDSQTEREREPAKQREHREETSPAKKRPVGAADARGDSEALKRPRPSEVSRDAKQTTPATPSKKPAATTATTTTTAMSRVSSANSLAQTPTDQTPSVGGSGDKRPNGAEPRPEARTAREKEERLKGVGRKLKHEGEQALKQHRGESSVNLRGKPGERGAKLGFALSIESIVSFMMGFHAQNTHRNMHNKIGDPNAWSSMFPLMGFLQNEMRRIEVTGVQPLVAMLLMLHAVAVDEMMRCYVAFDPPGQHIAVDALTKHERKRYRLWAQVHDANALIAESSLRVDVRPWSSLDDVTDAALRVLRRWCADEKVDWTPEPTLRDDWPIKER